MHGRLVKPMHRETEQFIIILYYILVCDLNYVVVATMCFYVIKLLVIV